MQLRNGTTANDPRLDRLYEEDWRSLNYAVGDQLQGTPSYRPRSYTWSVNHWFDQGQEGACVGFAFAHELVARPQLVTGVDNRYARETIYWEAQKIDPWSGGAYPGASPRYEGTSILAGAKICQQQGFYESYYWGITLEEVARGLGYFGPAVIGVNWYQGMFKPDINGFIHPVGQIMGGHAIVVKAIKIVYKFSLAVWKERTWGDVDWGRSYVTLHNSWGPEWGVDGTAKLSLNDLNTLILQQGDVCFPKRTDKRVA